MPKTMNSDLSRLMDEVEEASRTPEAARRRGFCSPTAYFNLETPVAEVKMFGWDIQRLFVDPEYYVECMLRRKLWRWQHFPDSDEPISMHMDAWLGHYPEYTFVGMDVVFDSLGVPIISVQSAIQHDPDIRHLQPVDFKTTGWMPRILRWWDVLQEVTGGRMQVNWAMNWWRGCLDLAIQLRGYDQFIDDTRTRPGFVDDLLKFLVEQRCRWWEGYSHYFGKPLRKTDIGDDWINVPFISPRIFERFVLPRYLDIERFHGGIQSIHSCGNQAPVQRYMLEIKSLDRFEVSPWTSLEQSLANLPPDRHLYISVHPNDVLVSDEMEMAAKLAKITELVEGRPYDVGTSGLTPLTANLDMMIQKIQSWTRVARQKLEPVRAEKRLG